MWTEAQKAVIEQVAQELRTDSDVILASELVEAVRNRFNVEGLPYPTFSIREVVPYLPEGISVEGFELGWLIP